MINIKNCGILLLLVILQQFSFAQHHEGAGAGYADSINNGIIAVDTVKTSSHRIAMNTISNCHIHIEYGSPGVRGRVIWGGLVPYDEVWATGAHSATKMTTTAPIKIGDKTLPAGSYALFTIPGKQQFIFIVNKNYNQHLADDYKQSEDLLRFNCLPKTHVATPRLTYSILPTGQRSGELLISWENIALSVPFEVVQN
jgi:hypothetical protein